MKWYVLLRYVTVGIYSLVDSWERYYVRTWYQRQGQVITSHSICGISFLVRAVDTRIWHTGPYITWHITRKCNDIGPIFVINKNILWSTRFPVCGNPKVNLIISKFLEISQMFGLICDEGNSNLMEGNTKSVVRLIHLVINLSDVRFLGPKWQVTVDSGNSFALKNWVD